MMPARNSSTLSLLLLALAIAATPDTVAAVMDEDSAADPWLDAVAATLESRDTALDVARNLNHRDFARRVERPRLGAFPDLPVGLLPDSQDLIAWELLYNAGEIGGIAVLPGENNADPGLIADEVKLPSWMQAPTEARRFISFHASELSLARDLAQVISASGYNTLLLEPAAVQDAGRFYVLAGLRLAIDSRDARRLKTEVREFAYLGERLGRNEDSLFGESGALAEVARNEPAVFRKATLGDEQNASTIEEIVVPGGIALGEIADAESEWRSVHYIDDRLQIESRDGRLLQLPEEPPAVVKALFDFVLHSEAINSDAVVDIDGEGRVRISAALRDTDVGYELMKIDTFPFEYVRRLPVTKSVILDNRVKLVPQGDVALGFETVYEVRFLSADTMRIAQTRVALEYIYRSPAAAEHSYEWGRDLRRLDENLDYAGLGVSTTPVARYAAWVALLRKVYVEQIPFVTGRYEFMKVDKVGRETPSRF